MVSAGQKQSTYKQNLDGEGSSIGRGKKLVQGGQVKVRIEWTTHRHDKHTGECPWRLVGEDSDQ